MTHHNSFARVRRPLAQLMIPLVWLAASSLGSADTDPPGRVARVNFLEGSGSMQAAGVDGWSDDLLNRPLTGGDRVWIDERSRAEMHVGSTALRLGSRTAVQILAVDDTNVRLSLTAGSISVRIRNLDAGDHFDIETPAGQVSLRQPGAYRLDVDDSNARAYLAVWTGSAEVSGPSGARPVGQEQSAELVAGAEPAVDTATASNTDSLDLWAEDRDQREDQSSAAQYVSRDVVGYQDLDGYGQWVTEPSYGMVWVPVVAAGWAPYHNGYWNWIAPWGWTWIANEPWGFAPCHYGRWVHGRYGWGWVPGSRWGPPPVYAPALVAWRGERYPKTNPDIMHRPKVGWVPLGYNEAYDPPFHASPNYVRAANLSNTHLGRADVERYVNERQHSGARGPERRYANDNVAGAYSDAPREAFASAKPIGRPRAFAEPNDSIRAKFAPHEVWSAAPVDRPVAHPVGYAPVTPTDRPRAPASTRIHVESSQSPDRPPQQAQTRLGRAPQISYVAPSQPDRQLQPVRRESEPRQYSPAPVRSAAPPAAPMAVGRDTRPQTQPAVRESEPRQYPSAPVRSAAPPAAPPPAPRAVGRDAHPQVSGQVRQP
jgi:hypothetical protein